MDQQNFKNSRYHTLYDLADRLAEKSKGNFEEILTKVFEMSTTEESIDKISTQLESSLNSRHDILNPQILKKDPRLWLIIGETGQGKSLFVNSLAGRTLAKEGGGYESTTFQCEIFKIDDDNNLLAMDTIGFFETGGASNREMIDSILQKVQEYMKGNSKIEGVLWIWAPNQSFKLRFDEIFAQLKKGFGNEIENSLVFVVNKFMNEWQPRHQDVVDALVKDLEKKKMNFPILQLDLKNLTSETKKEIMDTVSKVTSYKKEYFDQYRRLFYFELYEKILEKAKEKEREEKLKKDLEETEKKLKQEQERNNKLMQQPLAEGKKKKKPKIAIPVIAGALGLLFGRRR